MFGLEDITPRSILMVVMMVIVKGGDVMNETASEEE